MSVSMEATFLAVTWSRAVRWRNSGK